MRALRNTSSISQLAFCEAESIAETAQDYTAGRLALGGSVLSSCIIQPWPWCFHFRALKRNTLCIPPSMLMFKWHETVGAKQETRLCHSFEKGTLTLPSELHLAENFLKNCLECARKKKSSNQDLICLSAEGI